MSTRGFPQDASMLELFRMEAQAQTAVLNAGLLVLEHTPDDATQLEACMRAAHSLKGAARIIDLEAGVQVAHDMEELLVAAQRGELRLGASHIDMLLQGCDALLALSEGRDPNDLNGQPRQAQAQAPQDEAETEPEPEAQDRQDRQDRLLRVSAERLNLLLDLSGRSLVAARQAQPLQDNLRRLALLQDQARQLLDTLREHMLGQKLQDPQSLAYVGALNEQLRDAQALLQEHAEAFESYAWDSGQRSQRLYDAALASRMRPCADLMAGKDRMVRDLGRALGKPVRLELEGQLVQADRDVLERLEAPLIHLLRNAVDHGIEAPDVRQARGKPETGLLRLRARHAAGSLVLELEDDGGGVELDSVRQRVVERGLASAETAERLAEEELLAFLFLPGFSMTSKLSDISGRGVGLNVVQHELRALRGDVFMRQRGIQGSVFRLELPLTLSVVRSVVVEIGGEAYALPLAKVERMLRLQPESVTQLEGRQHIWFEGRPVGLIPARQLLQLPASGREESDPLGLPVVLLRERERDRCHALAVERFIGEQSLVVMPMDPRLGPLRDVAAGALLDDGTPALILDVDGLLGSIGRLLDAGQIERASGADTRATLAAKRVLVVDDSLTVRELERKLLTGRGYEVTVAVDGMDGWNALHAESFDLLVTDIDMPRMDGIELVTLLRRDARLQSLPVIVVSYKDREEDRRRGLEAGADHYLAKSSFHDTALLDAVQMLIGAATS